jgi:hypothetical protein
MDSVIDKVKDVQTNFYSNTKKNIFFKNKQKFDCASTVCENIPITTLMSNTIYIIPDTHNVFVDYTIFKLFANPDNFATIVDNIIDNFSMCIDAHSFLQLHINLDSFTVSALERYKELIKLFCNKCLSSSTRYSSKIEKVYIYNPPKTFDSIVTTLKPFIDPNVYGKIVICDDEQSKNVVASFQQYRNS